MIKTCAPLYHLHLNYHILTTKKLMLSLLNYLSKFPLELTGNPFSSELYPHVRIMITLETLHKISNFFSLLKYIKVPRFKSYFKSRSPCSYCMLSINFLYCNLHWLADLAVTLFLHKTSTCASSFNIHSSFFLTIFTCDNDALRIPLYFKGDLPLNKLVSSWNILF